MEIVKIGQGYELPIGAYCGIRIEENKQAKLEVRLTGGAAAALNANRETYGEVYDWLEKVAITVYNTGEVDTFKMIEINSTHINDKPYVIKYWRNLIK